MEQNYDLRTQRLNYGKRVMYLCIIALILALLMFIAGSVMLGIGIHKSNQNNAACPAPSSLTTTPTVKTSSTTTTTSTTTTATTTTPNPNVPQNVMILLDGSRDIAGDHYQAMKDYIATQIIPNLPINVSTATRAASSNPSVAILSYSEESVNIHTFYDLNDVASLQITISNIPQSQTRTSVSKATSTVSQLLSAGSQQKLMMVMGSGNQQDLQNAASSVQNLGNMATSISWIALGLASNLNFSQISGVATVYNSPNYTLSADDTKKLLNQLNPSNLTPPPVTAPPITPPSCNNDVILLIDESYATKDAIVFNQQLAFLTDTINKSWTVNPQNIEVVAISYSAVSATALGGSFNYNSSDKLIADINKKVGNDPVFAPSITAGLSYAQSHLQGRRNNTNLSTLLITYSSMYEDIVTAVSEINKIGGQLVVLGVGDNIIKDYLYYLSGTVITSSDLFGTDIANSINQAICASPQPPSPLPSTAAPNTTSVTSTMTPSSTTNTPDSYIPCESNILFVQDLSDSISDIALSSTLDLTSKYIVQDKWTHFERVGLTSYALNSSCAFGYGSFNTKNDLSTTLQGLQQFTAINSITSGLQTIETYFQNFTFLQNVVFYTSKADPADVQSAIPAATRVSMNGKLIIVAISPGATAEALSSLANDNTKIITLNLLDGIAFGTIADEIRKQFVLSAQAFQNQLSFIAGALNQINHPEMIDYNSGSNVVVPWMSGISLYEIQNQVTGTKQATSLAYRLRPILGGILSAIENITPNSTPVGAIVFVTDTTTVESIDGADQYATMLKNQGVKLTFILMGPNVDKNKLTNLTTNFVTWTDLTKPQPDNWDPLSAFACNGTTTMSTVSPSSISTTISTQPMTSTQPTTSTQIITTPSTTSSQSTSSTQITTTPSTTSMTSSSSTTTAPPIPAFTCRSYIPFSYDVSTKLSADEFAAMKQFLLNPFLQPVFPIDIQPALFSSYSISNFPIQRLANVSVIISYITQYMEQGSSVDSDVTAPLSYFSTQGAMNNTDGLPVNTVIYAGTSLQTSKISKAQSYVNQLTANGNTVTVVLVDPNIDQRNYKKITGLNIVVWSDPATTIANIEANMKCSGTVSTTSTSQSTSTMSSTPSTSAITSAQSTSTQSTSAITSAQYTSTMTSTKSTSAITSTQSAPQTTTIITTQSTTTPSQYLPCKSFISFSADISQVLSAQAFQNQLSFIAGALNQINHPEMIDYNSGSNVVVPWMSGISLHEIQNQVTGTKQDSSTLYRLRPILGGILSAIENITPNSTPVGAIVFVTDTTTAGSIDGADQYATMLKNQGVKLTFILMGPNVDKNKLTNLTTNFVTWTDLTKPQPDNWDPLSAFACNGTTTMSTVSPSSISTTISTQPMTSTQPTTSTQIITTPSTTTASQYIPCSSWISFSGDNSNVLSSKDFSTVINFISTAIGEINHPERLQYTFGTNIPVQWKSGISISQIQSNVKSSVQDNSLSYSLRDILSKLYTAYTTTPPPLPKAPIGALVFVSDTSSPSTYSEAEPFAKKLKAYGITLTFVLLGPNVDKNKLTNLTTNFITWTDLTQSQPDNWNNSYLQAYVCPGSSTQSTQSTPMQTTSQTSQMTTSAQSTSSTQITTTPSTTSMTSSSSTTTAPPIPAFTCRSYIPFSYDESTKLSADEFAAMKQFLLNPFLQPVFPIDIQPALFSSYSISIFPFQRLANVSVIISYITQYMEQGSSVDSDVTAPLSYFSTQGAMNNTDGLPVNTVIYAGTSLQTSKISKAQSYVNQLTANGNTVTVVLVDPKIDQRNYKKITGLNIVIWSDPATTIANIEANMNCNGGTSTGNPTTATSGTTTAGGSAILPTFTCNAHIPFAYDTSSFLTEDQFTAEKNLLLGPFLTTIMPINIQPSWFTSFADQTNSPRSRSININDIATFIKNYPQLTTSGARFSKILSDLNTRGIFNDGDNKPVNTVIFTGSPLLPDDIDAVNNQIASFTTNGNKLIVVFMRPDQIYNMLYNSKFTKSERKLNEIENEEKNEQDSDSDTGNGNEEVLKLYPQLNKPSSKVQIRLPKDNNEDDALIEIGKSPGSASARSNNDDDRKSNTSRSKILDKAIPGILKKKLNLGDKDSEADEDDKSGNWKDKIKFQKLIPDKFQRSVSNDGTVDEDKLEKQRQKEAKKAEKTQLKEARRLRKIELRKQARIERQRKNIADSIDLMLQCLRSCCALAILAGNMHRHFAPATPFENPYNSAYNDPELLMLFTITTSLDVFLFWIMLVMTYFRQCRLCCRLGICKFWLWLAILISLMVGVMLKPMHYVYQQLDPTWCAFMPGTDLGKYLHG